MTDTEVERLSRMLTDMRIEAASQFATLHAKLEGMPDLTARVTILEQANSNNGKFTWNDVFKVVAGGATLITAAYTITHWA